MTIVGVFLVFVGLSLSAALLALYDRL